MTAGFEAFFRANYPPVITALTIALGSPELAEDAAQHGFLQALRRWRRVARKGNPVGWVYVVAVRQARRSGGAHLEWSPTDEPTEGGADAVIERMVIAEALGWLTPSQRTVFVLRHVADLSAVDVAASLGVAQSTVRVLDHQARTRLRAVLCTMEDGEALDAV